MALSLIFLVLAKGVEQFYCQPLLQRTRPGTAISSHAFFLKYRVETLKKSTSIIALLEFEKNLRFPRLLCYFCFVTSYILVKSLRMFQRLLRYNQIKIKSCAG